MLCSLSLEPLAQSICQNVASLHIKIRQPDISLYADDILLYVANAQKSLQAIMSI
jgi:hypothetical protein